PTARPSRAIQVERARPRLVIAAPLTITKAAIIMVPSQISSFGQDWQSTTRDGSIASEGTRRNEPNHLPSTICRVESGVTINTSRLPRTRSSASEVAAETLRRSRPIDTWRPLTHAGTVPAWVNGLQVSIGLLLLSVSAATSLAEERVRGSLDVLMVTPLSTRQIVLGKWLGSFRLVPSLAILPSLVVLCQSWPKLEIWLGTMMIAAFVIVSGAAITSLGLALSTWIARLGRAV